MYGKVQLQAYGHTAFRYLANGQKNKPPVLSSQSLENMAHLMTYEQVEALCKWLEGPEGCHFRPHPGQSDDFTWNCDHSLKLTRNWLKRHNLDVEANVEALQAS